MSMCHDWCRSDGYKEMLRVVVPWMAVFAALSLWAPKSRKVNFVW